MGFLRPVRMAKVGVIGLKTDRETILSVLHDQGVIQVEPLRKETLAIFPAEATPELQRQVADQLLRIRGIKSALPPTAPAAPRRSRPSTACSQRPGRFRSRVASPR